MKKLFSITLAGLILFPLTVSAFTYKFLRVDGDTQPAVIQPYLIADPIPLDNGGTGVTSLSSLLSLLGISNLSADLAGKESTIIPGNTSQYWRGDKSWQTLNKAVVGLLNVDNTSDLNKPISTAMQTALDDKAALSHIHSASDITSGTKTSSFISDFISAVRNSISVTGNGSYNSSTGVIAINNPVSRSFNNAPGRSIVTSTGAVGFQVSSTRDSFVSASVGIVTTSSIGSGQDGYIAMEIAPTNSATPGDWVEIGRVRNGQTFTLAVALQGVQTIAGDLARMVPAGYYVKYRAVNVTGTPSSSWVSGQEVLLN